MTDGEWWKKKHAEDCGSLAVQLHRRTEQLADAEARAARAEEKLATIHMPDSEIEAAKTDVLDAAFRWARRGVFARGLEYEFVLLQHAIMKLREAVDVQTAKGDEG